jgi:hypothetical protein
VDLEMEAALERTMHTVGLDWGAAEGQEGEERLVDRQQPPATPLPPSAIAIDANPAFVPYVTGIEPPSSHTVYYGGPHPRSFWRQGREVVQVVVPVPPEAPKAAVRFSMESKTRLFLAVGDDVIFDRELAQPVYRDTSYWYFEQLPGEGGGGDDLKAIVLELDKRLAYSNWPRLFPEDPDLSSVHRQQQEQKQKEEEQEQEQQQQ